MRNSLCRAAMVMFVAACGDLAGDTDAVSAVSIVLCELDVGSYGALLPYAAMDADGDGFTVPASGEVCTEGTLPPPYRAAENGLDCDDGDPAADHLAVVYPDQDGDGVGATPRQVRCIGAMLPPGFARGGYDEDDDDPGVIETDDDFVLDP